MVVRLTKGSRVAGAIRYNERKVQLGQAVQLGAENFGHPRLAQTSVGYKTKTLEHLTRRNPRVRQPCIHCALAFHPEERFSDVQMHRISTEFMTDLGYGAQPYLLYRHHDTAHPHVHIVTVTVASDGRAISDAFLHRRISRIRRRLEQRHGLRPAQGQAVATVSLSPEATLPDGTNRPAKPQTEPVAPEMEFLQLLRLVEQACREFGTGAEKKNPNQAQTWLDDLILRHGVPALEAQRAVQLFLANQRARRGATPVETNLQPQPSTSIGKKHLRSKPPLH